MPTFLTNKKMSPALRSRIEASLARRRPGDRRRQTSRMMALARVGLMASFALILLVIWIER
jgi:hypothetical protein